MAHTPTLKQLLQDAKADPAVPFFWAKAYLGFVLGQPASFFITHDDYTPDEATLARYQDGLKKMANGTPLAYLTGVQGFWRHEFLVNEHTLIPRPDSELLVETVLDLIKQAPKKAEAWRILDLGTGSGCLAISLDLSLNDAGIKKEVIAIDRSEQALAVAKENNARLGADVSLFLSDWLSNVSGSFDIILSNPPYIKDNDPHLSALNAEPLTALVAYDDGLGDIKTIIKHASAHLKTDAYLIFEHGYDQGEAVRTLLKNAGFTDVLSKKDYGNNERTTLGRWA
ncbi:MAG: peptide chain release factor N(5)-glutamine methyltransferase [Moraxella sp.]|nr:peptide chain release factor N(5)-glutamine methyltransferase [Moraxella sp.]